MKTARKPKPTLAQFMSNPDGSRKRGAIARVSEHLQVSPATVKKWLSGEWSPGRETANEIEAMIALPLDLSSRCIGRSGRKKQK